MKGVVAAEGETPPDERLEAGPPDARGRVPFSLTTVAFGKRGEEKTVESLRFDPATWTLVGSAPERSR